jgi:hypothetical protein
LIKNVFSRIWPSIIPGTSWNIPALFQDFPGIFQHYSSIIPGIFQQNSSNISRNIQAKFQAKEPRVPPNPGSLVFAGRMLE